MSSRPTFPPACGTFRPIGQIAAVVVADLAFRRSIQTVIDQKLDRYTEIEPEALEVTGDDGFWPVPVRKV